MFLPNEVENYQQISVSDDMKNQILKKVDKTHRRNKRIATRFAAATACLFLIAFGVSMYSSRSHILSIDGEAIICQSRTLDDSTPSLATTKENLDLQVCVPLKVNVSQDAIITVSAGTLTLTEDNNLASEEQVSSLCINKSENIFWYLNKKDAQCTKCIIETDDTEYVYELFFEEKTNNYNLRQIENK